MKWFGWPGIIPETIEEKTAISDLLAKENCVPIWIEQDTVLQYQLFIDRHLTPLFHNYRSGHDFDVDLTNQDLWRAYQDVNQLYVKSVNLVKNEGDLIWVQNLYLMLVPSYVKRNDVNASVGWYLHTPFPHLEVLKTFMYCNEIVKSLLCSDVIGFHLYEDARHFYRFC